MVLNGQVVRGSAGMAGEFGHVTIQEGGPLCSCGNRGCWEVCASNTAAIRYYTESVSRSRTNAAPAPEFEDLLRLAEQGDTKAAESLDRMAHYLGEGVAMLITGLAPDIVVLIGEVTQAWSRVHPIMKKVLKQRGAGRTLTRLVPTDPSTQPRLQGTIALVLEKHLGAPSVA
jgi:predicted NBD/HSP70 family sugar kinase